MSEVFSEPSVVTRVPLTPVNQNIKLGIIGAPNVGKSLLFNLLTGTTRPAEVNNALFTTVDPNVATYVPVDDKVAFFKNCHPTAKDIRQIHFTVIDTPAIVENSYLEGEGVGVSGLKSLVHAELLLILVKCFQSRELASYDETIDALRSLQILEQELLLMDLNRVETVLSEVESALAAFPATETLIFQQETLVQVWEHIAGVARPIPIPPARKKGSRVMSINRVKLPERCLGLPVRLANWDTQQREVIHLAKLLTAKDAIYLANLTSLDLLRGRVPPDMTALRAHLQARADPAQLIPISLELEERMKLADTAGEGALYRSINTRHQSAFPSVVDEVYRTLHLVRFYLADDRRVHVYTCRHGTTAAEGANLIDVHISRSFIRVDVITFEEYVLFIGDRLKLAMEGKIRAQGRKYIFNDGDLVEFAFHAKSKAV